MDKMNEFEDSLDTFGRWIIDVIDGEVKEGEDGKEVENTGPWKKY